MNKALLLRLAFRLRLTRHIRVKGYDYYRI